LPGNDTLVVIIPWVKVAGATAVLEEKPAAVKSAATGTMAKASGRGIRMSGLKKGRDTTQLQPELMAGLKSGRIYIDKT
jgi:hypothetical protein